MRISLISLDQAWEDKTENKRQCEHIVKLSSEKKVDLVVFPEMTLTGFSMNTAKIAEKLKGSETIDFFQQLALKNNIAIVFGVVVEERDRASNRLLLISPNGDIKVNYTKIHPFSYSSEDKYYTKGQNLGQTIFKGINLGFSICYDLRFPELYQGLSEFSEVIITIANWPKKRIEHWEALLKARAIENQSIMVGVNRIGTDGNGIEYVKSSMVFSEAGYMIEPEFTLENADIYNIDTNSVSLSRSEFPMKNDRRKSLYKTFYDVRK